MTRTILTATAVLFCVTSCGTIDGIDRVRGSRFKILPNGHFEYWAGATILPGEDPAKAPVGYERWLRAWLEENGMCQNGYSILESHPVKALGAQYSVTYIGRCL